MKMVKMARDRAYLAADLFVPRDLIVEEAIRARLTFGVGDDEEVLAHTHPFHLEVPRNAFDLEDLEDLGIPWVDLRPRTFREIGLRPKPSFSLRPEQMDAEAALTAWGRDAVLNLACGRGKTILAWNEAAKAGGPVLFLAPQGAHVENALDELRTFFDFSGSIGRMMDGKLEWDRDLVVGTVQSVANAVLRGRLPPEFHHHFALTIYDEAHHMAAGWFRIAGNVSQGRRLGLTAEKERRDAKEGIFFSHLGQIAYSDTEPDLVPDVIVIPTGVVLTAEEATHTRDKTGETHVGKLRKVLGTLARRNDVILEHLRADVAAGRTLYVVTHSPDHARLLHTFFPWAGLILDDSPHRQRLIELRKSKMVIVTTGVGAESYNRKDLDCVHLCTPPGAKDGVATQFNQCAGRALRGLEGKPTPLVKIYDDEAVELCHGLVMSIVKYCHQRGWPVTWLNSAQRTGGTRVQARTPRA